MCFLALRVGAPLPRREQDRLGDQGPFKRVAGQGPRRSFVGEISGGAVICQTKLTSCTFDAAANIRDYFEIYKSASKAMLPPRLVPPVNGVDFAKRNGRDTTPGGSMFFGEGAVRVLRTLPSGDRYESPTRKTMMFLGAARIRWMLLPEFHEGRARMCEREKTSLLFLHDKDYPLPS